MKCIVENRLQSYSTPDSGVSDLDNIAQESPSKFVTTLNQTLNLELVTTPQQSTAIAVISTNASNIVATVKSYDNYVTGADWVLGDGITSYVTGNDQNLTFDGSQVLITVAEHVLPILSHNTIRVSITPANITSGAITGISLGGVIKSVSITSANNNELLEYEFYVKDLTQPLQIIADNSFTGDLTSINVVHVGLNINYDLPFGGYLDEFMEGTSDIPNTTRKSFMIPFTEAMLDQAQINITLTGDATLGTFIGPVIVGNALGIEDPHYGLIKTVKINDVEIKRLDGSVYRRRRTPQCQYTGKLYTNTDGYAIYQLEKLLLNHGTHPKPWVISDRKGNVTFIYGGLYKASRTYSTYKKDTFHFTIIEEV